jgi:hypothetical protein
MENNFTENKQVFRIKEFLKSWKFWKPFLAVVVGGVAGFLYYHFIGCNSGSCAITGNPYMSVLWGGMLGLFITNSPCARGRC